jgi:plastocyanin
MGHGGGSRGSSSEILPECNFAFPPDRFSDSESSIVSMRNLIPVIYTFLALPFAPVTAGPATGAVTGTVPLPPRQSGRAAVEKYTGTISGKVGAPPQPRAGVWIEGGGVTAGTTPPRVVLSQEGYQFAHSLIIVPRGTTVEFPNNDNDYHNVYSLSRPKPFDANRYKKNENPSPVVTFDKVGFVRLRCEIHDHMKSAVIVVDSPWCTVTDAAGKFSLTGIPPGNYTLRAQLDEKSQWSCPVTISSGKTTPADFTQPATTP